LKLSFKSLLLLVLSFFITDNSCKHTKLNPLNVHDNYCPDCGKQVVIDWYIIRCTECSTKRSGYHLYNDYLPGDKFCKRCGSNKYKVEIRQEIQFYEYVYASYKMREVAQEVKPAVKKSKTRVWVEPSASYPVYQNINRFNNFKLLPATVST
jgi:hypothetical protein